MSMEEACSTAECPSSRSVYRKMAADAAFGGIIARAREAQQHAEVDRTVEMADKATPENWQAVKLQIWARQWRASKLAPKVYGDRVTQEHTGADGGAIQITSTIDRPPSETREEWIARRQRELDQAKLLMGAPTRPAG